MWGAACTPTSAIGEDKFGDDAECTQHKPHPFPYLLAAGQLGLPPAQCLAFEDSLSGIRSAQAAGMHVVGVKNAMNTQLAADPAVIGTPPAMTTMPKEETNSGVSAAPVWQSTGT